MKTLPRILLLVFLALIPLSLPYLGLDSASGPAEGGLSEERVEVPAGPAAERDGLPAATASDELVVRAVEVRDLDGWVAWRGDVDLAPALARITAGEGDPHPNDGGIFQNREGLLPARPQGHYREYVVRTPGISHAGPQRLVIGVDGKVYYTHDHYNTFQRIR